MNSGSCSQMVVNVKMAYNQHFRKNSVFEKFPRIFCLALLT